ncbi:hypothetical protein [Cupriavidus sp. AcVe19-1a]|uniref:hypothetical protein n=1 Tax=Cupriavidus sp. AcVe19-1a TaxID=2821359 RepID=UPI001AE65A5F|nr:hypothetical protein [Cupriavidus sp. AcVe19-1a]MBP0633453.1 hypothetical protein [Cupriavidus sp. AcVe19-1a]
MDSPPFATVPNDAADHIDPAGGWLLRYEEHDESGTATGRGASIVGVEFAPRHYADLAHVKLNQPLTIPLNWRHARILQSNIPGFDVESVADGQMTVESPFSVRTLGLVPGGWLPAGLALRANMTVLLDRCTISELAGRFRDGRKTKPADQDFLDLFAGQRVRINPLLFALEGNTGQAPTPELVVQQLEEARARILAALPDAELVPAGTDGLAGILGLLQDTQAGMARANEFLRRLAPRLNVPVGVARRSDMRDLVLATATDCGLRRDSLVVVAALSAVAVPNGKSPAKRLLKWKTGYSERDAYNALVDLRALELLIGMFALFPRERLMLCTGDKDLALFWAGIRASEMVWRDGRLHCTLSPCEALLPSVTERNGHRFAKGPAPGAPRDT